jgi:hypothetical protein
MKKRRRKHWYHQTFTECVVCFAFEACRERRYGRRPSSPEKRYHHVSYMCSECAYPM